MISDALSITTPEKGVDKKAPRKKATQRARKRESDFGLSWGGGGIKEAPWEDKIVCLGVWVTLS